MALWHASMVLKQVGRYLPGPSLGAVLLKVVTSDGKDNGGEGMDRGASSTFCRRWSLVFGLVSRDLDGRMTMDDSWATDRCRPSGYENWS